MDGARILRERHIIDGKIQTGGGRGKPLITDYILVYKNRQLAVIEGEIEEGKVYKESNFNHIIEIKERERKHVQLFMDEISQNEKALVFCAT